MKFELQTLTKKKIHVGPTKFKRNLQDLVNLCEF